MDIKTKYNIKDKVFFVKNGAILNGEIDQIVILLKTINIVRLENGDEFDRKTGTSISCCIKNEWYDENVIYPSKEELINSLQDETDNNK